MEGGLLIRNKMPAIKMSKMITFYNKAIIPNNSIYSCHSLCVQHIVRNMFVNEINNI